MVVVKHSNFRLIRRLFCCEYWCHNFIQLTDITLHWHQPWHGAHHQWDRLLGAGLCWTLEIISYVRSYSFQDADNNMLFIFWGRSFFVAGSVLQPGAVGGWGQGSCLINWRAQLELQTKVIRRFPKILQSRRRPLLGPSPGWKRLLALSHLRHYTKQPLAPR